jgi:putative peptide zinc metalloprotease protein
VSLPAEMQDVGFAPVPERPVLAPGVRLAGEMQYSGFQESQWLIERDGRFLQLSEPLYRVAEQIDGQRSHEEIAAAATAATSWRVTAEHVSEIIRHKLLPAGVVLDDDGLPVIRQSSRPSPLQMQMRMKAMGPRIIDPVTRALQWLYWPPAMVALLVLIGAAQYWAWSVHGLGGSLMAMIKSPALTLVVLPLMLLAGLVHEFGHASALRYGGGRARRIGAGLYLVWPAFYTDTSDSYRLSRGARVRVDLGGFYFHLLFTVAVVGLYLLTGAEFLLIIVLVIDLDILRQLLFPFARLDGYWLLADLTGMPDFFSQAGPFMRRVFRRPSRTGRMPDLKPWAARVFGVYLLVTIPVLAAMLTMMVIKAPGLTTAAWDSLVTQAHSLKIALARGDALNSALYVLQGILLMIPPLASALLLFVLARWSLVATSTRRPAR